MDAPATAATPAAHAALPPDTIRYAARWRIRKYADDRAYAEGRPFEEAEVRENLLLNEGIGELLDLIGGVGGTAWGTGAYLGVGDDSTAEAATQTDLQAASNKLYKQVSGAPTRSGQTMTWTAVFASADANFNWREFTLSNTSAGTGKNLNRKVSTQGTKASGQTWTLQLAITIG